jgi:acyl carrier protein
MDYKDVFACLAIAIREETGNAAAQVEPATTADDIPGWDSLAHVRIVMNVEARTGAMVEMSDTYKAANAGQLCEVILRSIPAAGA